MTLDKLLKVISSIEKIKVVDYDTMETLYDNLYPIELKAIAPVSGVDLEDYTVKTVGSLLDWKRNTTYTVIMVHKCEVEYGE